jgi:hypothetical protein
MSKNKNGAVTKRPSRQPGNSVVLPAFPELSASQRQFLDERLQRLKVIVPAFVELRTKLLSLGGVDVVLPHGTYGEAGWAQMREVVDDLLRRGETWPGHGARLKPGAPSCCHANSARGFLAGKGRVVSGYALSVGGLWRPHSWLIDNGGLIETTEPRLLYHGYVHTDEEAVVFALGQLELEDVAKRVSLERLRKAAERLLSSVPEAARSA